MPLNCISAALFPPASLYSTGCPTTRPAGSWLEADGLLGGGEDGSVGCTTHSVLLAGNQSYYVVVQGRRPGRGGYFKATVSCDQEPLFAGDALRCGDRVVVAASEGGAAAGRVLVLSAEAPTRVAVSSSSLRSDRLAVLRSCAASRRRPLWPDRNDDVKRSPTVKLMRQSGKQTPTGI